MDIDDYVYLVPAPLEHEPVEDHSDKYDFTSYPSFTAEITL
jgi:hypothetical protein